MNSEGVCNYCKKISSGSAQRLSTYKAVHKELKKMIDLGVIEPKGEGKSIYYITKTG